MRDRGDWKIRFEKNFIGNRFFFFFSQQAQGEESHFIGNECGNERKWDEIEIRPGGRPSYGKSGNRSKKKGGGGGSRNQRISSLFKLFFPGTNRRKLAVAINKGAEFEMCATRRQLELSLSLSLPIVFFESFTRSSKFLPLL